MEEPQRAMESAPSSRVKFKMDPPLRESCLSVCGIDFYYNPVVASLGVALLWGLTIWTMSTYAVRTTPTILCVLTRYHS